MAQSKRPFRGRNRETVERARALRREMTVAERRLWYDCLRSACPRFMRQRPIGPFIVDFYCAQGRLVVEIDGDSHFTDEGRTYDAARTLYLNGLGLEVLRFTNHQVMESLEGVWHEIEVALKNR